MFPLVLLVILLQDMGRRVIGALKHAGRRRAAFSVAKDVAMFLRFVHVHFVYTYTCVCVWGGRVCV